jgi:hypothetical protein
MNSKPVTLCHQDGLTKALITPEKEGAILPAAQVQECVRLVRGRARLVKLAAFWRTATQDSSPPGPEVLARRRPSALSLTLGTV